MKTPASFFINNSILLLLLLFYLFLLHSIIDVVVFYQLIIRRPSKSHTKMLECLHVTELTIIDNIPRYVLKAVHSNPWSNSNPQTPGKLNYHLGVKLYRYLVIPLPSLQSPSSWKHFCNSETNVFLWKRNYKKKNSF